MANIRKKINENEYDVSKDILSRIKSLNENKEKNDDDDNDAIPITNDPKFGENVLQNQIDAFKQSVNGGAKFASENSEKAESNPLIFYPKNGNLVFSGSIPNMSDMKFQFSLNDITGSPYIFADGLALTEETITTLNKLRGFYQNWKEEWQASSDLLDKLGKEKK